MTEESKRQAAFYGDAPSGTQTAIDDVLRQISADEGDPIKQAAVLRHCPEVLDLYRLEETLHVRTVRGLALLKNPEAIALVEQGQVLPDKAAEVGLAVQEEGYVHQRPHLREAYEKEEMTRLAADFSAYLASNPRMRSAYKVANDERRRQLDRVDAEQRPAIPFRRPSPRSDRHAGRTIEQAIKILKVDLDAKNPGDVATQIWGEAGKRQESAFGLEMAKEILGRYGSKNGRRNLSKAVVRIRDEAKNNDQGTCPG